MVTEQLFCITAALSAKQTHHCLGQKQPQMELVSS